LLASLRQEGAFQTSEFINTLLRNPACRTAAQSSATPESAYMAIANQALNNAAQNRESIENSRIASDGSARSWIGNKWYRLKRGVSNNSGKVATAVLIAACVALYYMYGAEAIQNATGQAFTSVKEYAAYLAAQTGEYLTKLRNYFSGSPPPSAQTPVEQGMTMMTPDQLAKQEAHAGFLKNVVNPARQNMLLAQKSNLKQAVAPSTTSAPPAQSGAAQPTLIPTFQLAHEFGLAKSSEDSSLNANYFSDNLNKLSDKEKNNFRKEAFQKLTPTEQLAVEIAQQDASNNSSVNDNYFTDKFLANIEKNKVPVGRGMSKMTQQPTQTMIADLAAKEANNQARVGARARAMQRLENRNIADAAYIDSQPRLQQGGAIKYRYTPPAQSGAAQPALMRAKTNSSGSPPSAQTVQAFQKDDWKFSPGQQLANEYALAQSSTDSKINTDYFWKKYEKLPLNEQGKYLKANKANLGLIKGGASRNTNRREPARQAHRLAHKVRSPNLKQVLRKSLPSVAAVSPRKKAKPVTNKPAKNASKISKSPKSKRSNKRSNSNSPKSSHGMTLRDRT
jgi:hypothetical protein